MDASYCCTQCSHQAAWKFQLDHHIRKNHEHLFADELFHAIAEPELYTCFCGEFNGYFKLSRYEHYRSQHFATNTEGNDAKIDRAFNEFVGYPCDICKYKGHSSLSFIVHQCLCKIVARVTRAASKMNRKTRLEIRKLTNSKEIRSFQCDQCPYKSRFKSNLLRHAVQHVTAEDANWFHCTKCSYRAKHKGSVRKHDLFKHASVSDIDWFHCAECPYRAKAKGNLKKHMVKHAKPDDVDWLECAQCFYRTTHKGNLKSHMLQHHVAADEIDWFNCAKCSFRAKVKRNLDVHMLQHATEDEIKWFSCTKCTYRAKQNAHLKTHMLRHVLDEDVNWFNCEVCAYRSKRKEHLKSHMRTHPYA